MAHEPGHHGRGRDRGRQAPLTATIAAIATPPGRGGVGVVRVSGSGLDALIIGVIGAIPKPRVATVATFRDARGAPLDAGLALYFPAPHSYTGESVLELQGHGGPSVLRLILARCLELGARIADPGEFTRRAFLNGKLDLAQAESVADLIDAATSTAARAAARSLSGLFSDEVHHLVDALIELRMYTEATLDFPEEEVEFLRAGDVVAKLAAIRAALAQLLARAKTGALLREGLMVVLVGRPNVGKSSLLNALAREEAAIVTPVAGTTRDTVERRVEIAGIPLTVVDTAGLRDTVDPVEAIGIERTWAAVARADLVLLLVDARAGTDALDAEDRAILARLPEGMARVVVHNKTDLAGIAPTIAQRENEGTTRRHVWLSAHVGAGVELLEREVLAAVGVEATTEDTFLARERHVQALREASAHLAQAALQLGNQPPSIELFAEELREAQTALSAITGEFTADDLLGVIFGRFCIGK
ncbi:MAG: tRNA uridine-5-carboxymethylaminomethyl(34) synthesis GTPase MnmE [Casimicrobiaceae bacterium]